MIAQEIGIRFIVCSFKLFLRVGSLYQKLVQIKITILAKYFQVYLHAEDNLVTDVNVDFQIKVHCIKLDTVYHKTLLLNLRKYGIESTSYN